MADIIQLVCHTMVRKKSLFLRTSCAILAASTMLSGQLCALDLNDSWLNLDEMDDFSTTEPLSEQTFPVTPYQQEGEGITSPLPVQLTGEDLADMITQALERHDFILAEHFSRQLAQHPAPRGNLPMAAYGLALSLSQQERYSEALEALVPLQNAGSAFKKAAEQLAGTLHLQRAEIALFEKDIFLAEQELRQFETYSYRHPETLRAQRLWAEITSEAKQNHYLRVGVLLPLSGTHASIGQNLLKAMQAAVFEETNQRIILYPEDTGSDAQGISDALQRLQKLQPDAFIGPLLSTQVDALKKVLPSSHAPILALSSDPHVAAPHVHLFGYRPDQQTRLIARHAVSQGKNRFAALVPSTPYGYEVFDAFRDEIANLGAQLIVTNFYNPEKPDVSGALETLLQLDLARDNLRGEKEALQKEFAELGNALPDEKLLRLKEIKKAKPAAVVDFDALFLPARADKLSLITSQMAVYDLDRQDVMLLGTAAWDTANLLKGGDYIKDGRFPALPEKTYFTQKFTTDFQENPNALASLGYDAVTILAQAARTSGNLKENLLRAEGFSGVSGAIRFHENGLSERGYALKAISPGKLLHVKQSPKILPPQLPSPLNPEAAAPVWRYSPW
ncbi:MAG: penicillin-binding protein activator [Alphaproteobacteria bacterium]|nr:penicillin-binding protein activator [Alphaproteobacteria bacterium]MDD9919812.1 penicillin-binding protein activator [Alphaproteobacteria bacterium]